MKDDDKALCNGTWPELEIWSAIRPSSVVCKAGGGKETHGAYFVPPVPCYIGTITPCGKYLVVIGHVVRGHHVLPIHSIAISVNIEPFTSK